MVLECSIPLLSHPCKFFWLPRSVFILNLSCSFALPISEWNNISNIFLIFFFEGMGKEMWRRWVGCLATVKISLYFEILKSLGNTHPVASPAFRPLEALVLGGRCVPRCSGWVPLCSGTSIWSKEEWHRVEWEIILLVNSWVYAVKIASHIPSGTYILYNKFNL